jgi:cytidylate kinase/diadenosine tetraphosphate (Ap4A) HIT family hydrolase
MCTFCDWAQDELVVGAGEAGPILVDRAPLCRGHLLVVAPSHVASLLDLPLPERRRFETRIETARRIASEIGGRPAVAFEHGRSPTCGDPEGSCHAHVHVAPVGELQEADLERSGLLASVGSNQGPYLAIATRGGSWRRYQPTRPLPHAARTLASLVAEANGVSWQPLAAPRPLLAAETLREARRRLNQPEKIGERQSSRRRERPIITVSGPTGAGKTTIGAHLATTLEVPAIELGVVMRLLCLAEAGRSAAKPGAQLWRWARRGRLDFDGASQRGLAAAVPRLDGAGEEIAMWREVESERLAALAREPEVQEVLEGLARTLAKPKGAVIVGRVAPMIDGAQTLRLDAAAPTRAQRKRAQLARIELGTSSHDWFDPKPSEGHWDVLDTSELTPVAMCAAARSVVSSAEARAPIALAS